MTKSEYKKIHDTCYGTYVPPQATIGQGTQLSLDHLHHISMWNGMLAATAAGRYARRVTPSEILSLLAY